MEPILEWMDIASAKSAEYPPAPTVFDLRLKEFLTIDLIGSFSASQRSSARVSVSWGVFVFSILFVFFSYFQQYFKNGDSYIYPIKYFFTLQNIYQ